MSTPTSSPLQLKTSLKGAATPLHHFWSVCVGAGRAQEGLRANWLEHLEMAVAECGFQYVRFHGLFHDDMCVYREHEGKAIYNFQYIDELFDRMLELGARPFVEFSFFPTALAGKDSRTIFWWKGNITPPEKFDQWAELITRFVRHCIDRYGLEEVQQWYFEIWNEPNLDRSFWDGSRSQYFEMYRASVLAIKAIDPSLRVGGPATSNFVPDERFDGEHEDQTKQSTLVLKDLGSVKWKGVWIEAFLEFCAANKLPVDFVSCHPYPTDWPLDTGAGKLLYRTRPATATTDDLHWIRRAVSGSAFPKAEIHLTEWSSSPSPRDHSHDSLPAATYVVRANVESTGLVESLAYWVFTDVFEEHAAGDTIFHGGFGMINFQGIVKPTFHAYRFLHLLGDKEVARAPGILATRDAATGTARVLVYHYPPEQIETPPLRKTAAGAAEILAVGQPRAISVELTDLRPGASLLVETLDATHGFAIPTWNAMGNPEPPSREQTELLRESAWNLRREFFTVDASGTFRFERMLEPWTVLMIREVA